MLKENSACRVVEEYAPNEMGLAGMDGYREQELEVERGLKGTFNRFN
jgi:hypothetical protein